MSGALSQMTRNQRQTLQQNPVTRSHLVIENRLRWRLDVSMNEDQARNRLGHGLENLAVLRHMALNLLRKEPSKGSLPKKLRRADLSEAFLFKVLDQVWNAIAMSKHKRYQLSDMLISCIDLKG